MKKSTDLTLNDIQDHPVWTFIDAAAGKDVIPHIKSGPVPLMGLIRVAFRSNHGAEYVGFALHTKVSLVSPVILTEDGQVPLYIPNGRPSPDELAEAYRRLGCSATELFPLRMQPAVKTRNRPLSDTVEAFTYRDGEGFHQIK